MSNTLYVLTPDEYTFIASQSGITTAATKFTAPAADAVVSALKIGPALWRIDVNHGEEPFDELSTPVYIEGPVEYAFESFMRAVRNMVNPNDAPG